MHIKDKIVEKALEFRDCSIEMSKCMPMSQGTLNQKKFSSKLKEDVSTQNIVSDINKVTKELFELLDELDAIEGRELKR